MNKNDDEFGIFDDDDDDDDDDDNDDDDNDEFGIFDDRWRKKGTKDLFPTNF